ncbi:MAG: hypothetical protein J3R72DRAFT_496172 [Linnemannia gamsii]|nr:MAG: hypothetical protein J3R72DRAFT_496172 [Linnemannia gamsii]
MFTALTGIIDLRRHRLDGYSMRAPKMQEPDQDVIGILELLSRYLKLGFYVLFLKCEDMLGVFARDALEGKDMLPKAPLGRLVRYLRCLLEASSGGAQRRNPEVVKASRIYDCFKRPVADVKSYLASELLQLAHDTDSGRNVDLMLFMNGLEPLNSEAKPRMSAMVCGLQVKGDNFLRGAAYGDVIDLSTSKDGLASFLFGPSARLIWNDTDGIKEKLWKKRSASIIEPESPIWQAEAQEEDEQSEARTPPHMSKLYGVGKVTVFRPDINKRS